MNNYGKKSNLSIHPNNSLPSSRGAYSSSSPMKATALSEIVHQHSIQNLQSPGAPSHGLNGSYHPFSPTRQSEGPPTATLNRGLTMATAVTAATAASKLSKLQARKEKQNLVNTTLSSRKDPSTFLMTSHDEGNVELKQSLNQNQNVITKEMISKELEENFKFEKRNFLSKLQEENQLLLQLLEDVQESKASMMKRIKDLEVAKETLKALKAPVSLDAIDQYLIDECPLSESNRFELNLSASKVQEAQKVYDRLVSIMTVFKSHYTAYFEHIMEQLSDISDLFLNNRYKEMNDAIQQLEQINVLKPTNLEAARELSKSIEASLLHATSYQLKDFLKRQMSGKGMKSGLASAFKDNTTATVASEVGYGESKQDSLKYTNEEVKQILAINENLRETVAQLRQRLAQVRTNSVNTPTHSPLYGSPKLKAANKAAMTGAAATVAAASTPELKSSKEFKSVSRDRSMSPPRLPSRNSMDEPAITAEGKYVPLIPEAIQLLVISRLKSYLRQLIGGNPALPMISSNEVLLGLIIEQIIEEVHDQLFQIFEIVLKSHKDLQFIFTSNQKEIITQEYLERDESLIVTLTDCIDQSFQLTHVHAELLSWITFYCSYAYARMGATKSTVVEEPQKPFLTTSEINPAESGEISIDTNGQSVQPPKEKRENKPIPITRQQPQQLQQHHSQSNHHPPVPQTVPQSPVLTPISVTPSNHSLLNQSKSTSQHNLPRYMQSTRSFELNTRSPGQTPSEKRPFAEK